MKGTSKTSRGVKLVLLTAALSFAVGDGFSKGGAGIPGRSRAGRPYVQDLHRKTLYRPKAFFREPASKAVKLEGTTVIPLTIDFFVQLGWVGEIDLFVNGKRAATYPMEGRLKSGWLHVDFDLARWGPGVHSLRLEAAQGQSGKRSIRGRQLFSLKVRVD